MKKHLSILLAICAVMVVSQARSIIGNGGGDSREADLRSIVDAERGFARTSVEKGTRAAFIENLADDSVIFRPGPVNGKRWWSERPSRPGVLSWQPVFADVARSGDLGYTTGPWEFREKSVEDKPVAFGQYVTIWKREAGGVWKVAIDLGISNAAPKGQPPSDVAFPVDNKGGKKSNSKTDGEAAGAALLKMEETSARRSIEKRSWDGFLSYLADDVRLFRNESFPAVGKDAARALLATRMGALTWRPLKGEVSASGDLGYTYGGYEFKAADGKASESGNYLRIWKKQGGGDKWKVVLDILNPLPPAKPAG